jgi:hypothetical protein
MHRIVRLERMRRPRRAARARRCAALLALLACAATADAQAPVRMPVFLQQMGPKAVQVEVAAGRTGPCDSSYNAPIFRGWVEAGQTLRLATPFGCVCYRHTYHDFPQIHWSPSTVTCRRICTVQGGFGLCPADPSDAIFVSVRSSPP